MSAIENDDDIRHASKALIAWCQSQDLTPSEAIMVAVYFMATHCHVIAKRDGKDAKEGLGHIKDMMDDVLEATAH